MQNSAPLTPRERELMREIEVLKGQLERMDQAYERAMKGWSEETGSNFCGPWPKKETAPPVPVPVRRRLFGRI